MPATVVAAVQAGLAHHDTPAKQCLAGLARGPLAGSKTTKNDAAAASATPGGQLGLFGRQFQDIGGKLSTLFQVAAPSVLFHRPL